MTKKMLRSIVHMARIAVLAALAIQALTGRLSAESITKRVLRLVPDKAPLKEKERAEIWFLLNDQDFRRWAETSDELSMPDGDEEIFIVISSGLTLKGSGKKFLIDIHARPSKRYLFGSFSRFFSENFLRN